MINKPIPFPTDISDKELEQSLEKFKGVKSCKNELYYSKILENMAGEYLFKRITEKEIKNKIGFKYKTEVIIKKNDSFIY